MKKEQLIHHKKTDSVMSFYLHTSFKESCSQDDEVREVRNRSWWPKRFKSENFK